MLSCLWNETSAAWDKRQTLIVHGNSCRMWTWKFMVRPDFVGILVYFGFDIVDRIFGACALRSHRRHGLPLARSLWGIVHPEAFFHAFPHLGTVGVNTYFNVVVIMNPLNCRGEIRTAHPRSTVWSVAYRIPTCPFIYEMLYIISKSYHTDEPPHCRGWIRERLLLSP